jgi:hypothetical protein
MRIAELIASQVPEREMTQLYREDTVSRHRLFAKSEMATYWTNFTIHRSRAIP